MKLSASILAIALVSFISAPRCRSSVDDDSQPSQQLSLADLASYRAALSGKPTADLARASDPPVEVSFKDLWNSPDVFRGRRLTIEGRIARIFRQGPVGSFPPLAEVWITSSAGDPFCVVFPQPGLTGDAARARVIAEDKAPAHEEETKNVDRVAVMPELGQMVRFTGTFLKVVRYVGGDSARLAPLIVGERRPTPIGPKHTAGFSSSEKAREDGTRSYSHSGAALGPAYWAVGLAVMALAVMILARWHLRTPAQRAAGRQMSSPSISDPPLEFIKPLDQA